MRRTKPFILSTIILCSFLTACTVLKPAGLPDSHQNQTDTAENISSQQDILDLLLQTMYNNRTSCSFTVPDKSFINADYWLEQLPGLDSVHCEYHMWGSTCHVTASIEYWDNYPIVNAFKTGNTSALNERQRQMYDRYCEILYSHTSASDSALKNELAIHDYIVSHVEYEHDQNSKNRAYDALFNHTTSCRGYTELFQTFMDMLGIQCISVTGIADNDNHIWNMVCIDNEWYHVDVTWDDPVGGGGMMRHNYFNITDADILSDHTISSEHPPAVSTRLAYYNVLHYPLFSSQTEVDTYLYSQVKSRASSCNFQARNFNPDIRGALSRCGVPVTYRVITTDRPSYSTYSLNFEY